jgi:ketosteroid isomerase-like protein
MPTRRFDNTWSPVVTPLNRRKALTRMSASALGLTLATGPLSAFAQEATPSTAELPPVVQDYITAFEAVDADQIAATFAEDAVEEEIAFGETLQGREAIRQDNATFFAAFTSPAITVTNAFASGDQAAGVRFAAELTEVSAKLLR